MRMGRPIKKRSTRSQRSKQTINPNPPKFSSPTLIVGSISPNVIQSILAPALNELAVKSVEEYADALMVHEQAMVQYTLENGSAADTVFVDEESGELEDGEEVELDGDGNIVDDTSTPNSMNNDTNNNMPPPPPPLTNRLFQTQNDIDELSTLLIDTTDHFTTPQNTYKIHANAAKFERLLDEKYGKFRPFIESHPNVEIVLKNLQRKYAMGSFSPLRKDTPVSKTTAIMVLFMMHRQNVKVEALVLMALFCLVGLQPWALVTLVAVGKWEMERRKGRKVRGMPRRMVVCEPYYARDNAGGANGAAQEEESEGEERAKKYALLSQPVGTRFSPADLSLRDDRHDVLLLGGGVETLYTAALLSRAGRRVCVLSPADDLSECQTMEQQNEQGGRFARVPFDVKGCNLAHLGKQQELLAPALSTNTDTQGGIRFARVGSASDGYAHSVLSVPGLGTDSTSGESIPIVINAEGPASLAEYCSTCLGDGYPGTDLEGNDNGSSTSLGYVSACRTINAGSGEYYMSKLFEAGTGESLKSSGTNAYRQATLRPASAFLDKCLPLNAHVRCLMAAIGMCNENLSPENTSMAAHVSHLCAMLSEEGMAYPVGGPRALCHALTSVIEQCGGRVVSGVPLQELLFDKLSAKDAAKQQQQQETAKKKKTGEVGPAAAEGATGPKPRCRGVRLENGCEITVSSDAADKGAVISTLGFVPTFLHLFPDTVRLAHGVPHGVPAISERRPLMKIIIGLNGTKEELSLTGADWYRLPNATLPRDELDPLTGEVKFGTIGVDESSSIEGLEDGETSTEIPAGRGKRSKPSAATSSQSSSAEKKTPRSKFTSGASWMKVSFPSAKDPSWSDRHGSVSTCVVTIEADDDFVRMFDTKPKIYSILSHKESGAPAIERLCGRVVKDLMETFPQLEDKIECSQICGPYRSGLVQNPARFAIKGNKPKMPYPGLFIGGSDLTVGDSASGAIVGGWLAANAVMGYSFLDHLYLKKNITSDLQQFIDDPSLATERNGVIVEDLAVPFKDEVIEKKKGDTTAESTKEE